MFEDSFKIELAHLTTDSLLIDKLWSEIQLSYSRSKRYYHNLTHLDNLTKELLPIKNQIEHWQVLVFSVAYHDIVYNTLKKDNEERSAALAYDRMGLLEFPLLLKEKCRLQILATKHHRPTADADTNYFTDADLSILGSDHESYLNYTKQIRKEYGNFRDILYKPGRRKVLKRFLEMENIFKTDYFQNKFEDQAKANIAAELKSLT
jgi:predicted metal-dependent HD superfamily phosphohydrolase